MDPPDLLEHYGILAGAEASVSWIAWNNLLFAHLTRSLAPRMRADVFREPHSIFAQSTRPGGRALAQGESFRVSGRWELVSGCELAEWLLLLCEVEGRGEQFALLHKEQCKIQDTWYVGGLRGTGSHDVEVSDVAISPEQLVSPGDPPTHDGAWTRLPIISLVSAGFGAQTLGIARALLEATAERREAGSALLVGTHAAAIEAAETHLRDGVDRLWRRACAGEEATLVEIGAVYAATRHANGVARRAVADFYDAAGTRALYVSAPFERAHRDLRAMLQHIVAQPIWTEDAGRARLGLAPTHPLFAI
jgi:alkylation response protein AidB-like acyl-CoA dehydrogenase